MVSTQEAQKSTRNFMNNFFQTNSWLLFYGTSIHHLPAGDTWGQLLILSSFRVSLLLATRTFKEGSSSGVSSTLIDDNDLEFTKTTVSAEAKWACSEKLEEAGENVLK